MKTKFASWINQRIKDYDFVDGEDFATFSENLENGGRVIEYGLSLCMAQELSMIERTPRGKQARQYFIACERALYKVAAVVSAKERSALESQTELFRLKNRKRQLQHKVAPELREIKQITRQMGKLQDAAFGQLGLFESSSFTPQIENQLIHF